MQLEGEEKSFHQKQPFSLNLSARSVEVIRTPHLRRTVAFLGRRFRFPDNNRFGHLHVRMLLLCFLYCNSQGLMENRKHQSENTYEQADKVCLYLLLVHVVVSCDYDPLLDPRL